MNPMLLRTALLTTLLVAPAAQAYVGPGAGISLVGSLVGLVGVIALAIGSILLWPIRRMMKKRKKAEPGTEPAAESGNSE